MKKNPLNDMKKLKIISTLFILYALCLIFYSEKARAASLSLGVYPPVMQIQVNPPATIKQPLHIVNNGDNPFTLSIIFKPFKSNNSGNGQPEYLNQKDFFTNNSSGFLKYVTLLNDAGDSISQISLSPKQTKTVLLALNIPADINTGDQYFSIFFMSNGPSAGTADQALIAGGIAMNVLLSVGPQHTPSGYIKAFSSPFFIQAGPVPFEVNVSNNSSQYIETKGVITIKNMFGQEIGSIPLLPVDILARSSRFIPDSTDRSSTEAIWPEKVLFGPYTAKVTIALSDHGPVLTKTIQFFALPIQAIIGLVAAILISIFIVIRVRKRLE